MGDVKGSMRLYRGYKITFTHIGYSVYLRGHCVAAGGVLFDEGNSGGGNLLEGRRAVDALIAGTRKPL